MQVDVHFRRCIRRDMHTIYMRNLPLTCNGVTVLIVQKNVEASMIAMILIENYK